MKEAAGEANLTVVAIILIGVIAAVVTPLVTSLMGNTACRACCTDAGGKWTGGKCADAGSKTFDKAGYDKCAENAGNKGKCR